MNQRVAITSLKLTNVRRFSGAHSFNFTDPQGAPLQTIILAGPNGCGKTTILETILLMLGQRALIERGERATLLSALDLSGGSIELHVRVGDSDRDLIVQRDLQRTSTSSPGSHDTPHIQETIKNRPVEYHSSWRAPTLTGGIKPLGKGNRRAESDTNRLHNIKQRIIDQRAKKGFRPDAESKDDIWLAKLNQFWTLFRQDQTLINADYTDNNDPLFDLFLAQRDPDNTARKICSIDALSSGELELLQLAGSIITREVELDLLVIDEPELHLHPQWQSGLLPALRSLLPNTQLIIATHSDLIWDQALSFERFLLVPKDDPRHGKT